MARYLNGKAEQAIREATAAVLGISESEVTPEFFAQQEREIAARKRRSAFQLKEEIRKVRSLKPNISQPDGPK